MLKPNNSTNSTTPEFHQDENQPPTRKQRLDRSPHPYHRHSLDIPDRYYTDGLRAHLQSQRLNRPPLTPLVGSFYKHDSDYFDFDSRKRRRLTSSPSDSGTEADDERPSVMKGLPAATIRPRKGLKDLDESGIESFSSPLLTPSCLDEEPAKARNSRRTVRQEKDNQAGSDGEQRQIREKYTRRRRAELLRRVLESLSLASITMISVHGSASHVRTDLARYTLIISGLYLLYPLRLLGYRSGKPPKQGWRLSRLRIPVSYDPAPLLYPIFLPISVVLSMTTAIDRDLLVTNCVLGLCSLPHQVIPFGGYGSGYLHWLLSLLPSIWSSVTLNQGFNRSISSPSATIVSEQVALLYPLHEALVSCLAFMSTTSLLPAELQLLSVGLINLLIYSQSPQATILMALLWIGGVSLCVLCRHVLQWSVEIARVPSWRFRKPKNKTFQGNLIISSIDDCLGGVLRRYRSNNADHGSSGSDEMRLPSVKSSRRKIHEMPKSQKDKTLEQRSVPKTGVDTIAIDECNEQLGDREIEFHEIGRIRNRRHTLPTYIGGASNKSLITNLVPPKKLRTLSLRPKSFLSLTSAQAVVLKWFFALYVYLVVILIIALPVRKYIAHYALTGNEPVGWALGYLFGDIPKFRLQVVLWNLDNWICLPKRLDPELLSLCRAEHIRQIVIGPANTRLLIGLYHLTNIATGLTIVFRLSSVEVDTRRKVFHGMMVIMFLPTIFVDPGFAALALTLILAIFLLLDLFRASQLPPLSRPLTYFLAPYVDGRDHRGPIIVSHIFLLIGCAIPLWLSLAATERTGAPLFEGWDFKTRDLSMISGVICVGMGDAAASLVGRRFGRRKWPWSGGKSLEGSLAFAAAVVLGLSLARVWLLVGGWDGDSGDPWGLTLGKAAVSAAGASFTEAVLTGGNDNVVVPVILWLLVRGLRI